MTTNSRSQSAQSFWENIYRDASPETSGLPTHALRRLVENRKPGNALDLGCAKGDDIVWLAGIGWQAFGVDISSSALSIATENAQRNGVTDRTRFRRYDLAESFPEGSFDLVSALFLETPLEFPYIQVIRRAADAVRSGGLLLVATHQHVAPWSWSDPASNFPTAKDRLTELDLNLGDWRSILVGPVERDAIGPEGQIAPVTDAVIALERM